jgi:hypothetical protein
MIKTFWTLDITPLQRWIRLQIFRLSSLFPCRQLPSKQKDALWTYLATVSKSFLYTQGAIFSSALAFTEKLQFRHAYRRTLELLSDWYVRIRA